MSVDIIGTYAPKEATYITQTGNASLPNEQPLSALTTGVVKVTNGTGVLSTAVAGTDYLTPTGDGSSLTGIYVPGGTDVAVTDGGTGLSAIGQYELLYASAANTFGTITAAASSLLVTDGSNVPSLSTDIPTAVTIGTAYIYRVGGTDVAVADGGTGGSDAATAKTNLGFMTDLLDDTTPQLGGQLDINGNAIGDGTLELLTFTETGSAVNHINITNAATGNAPVVSAAGDDTDIDLSLASKGAGSIVFQNGTAAANEALSGTSVTPDASDGDYWTITFSGNTTLNAPTNPTTGQKIICRMQQDAGGNAYSITSWNAVWKFSSEITSSPTFSTGANEVDAFGAFYDGTSWNIVAWATNIA